MDTQAATPQSSVVETGSEIFSDSMVEAVTSAADPRRLCLETWNGTEAATTDSVVDEGITYVAPRIVPGLMQAIHFAPPSKPFGSASELVTSLRQFFVRYSRFPSTTLDVLIAFTLASWFTDCNPVAPVLYLLGPEDLVRTALRLLGCACRRPILLGDVDRAALTTLPARLGATLLIRQRHLDRGVTRTLRTSSYREFPVARGSHCIDAYGAKAYACETRPVGDDEIGVSLFLAPAANKVPVLTDAEAGAAREDFHAQLLRYRMAYYSSVRCRAEVSSGDLPVAIRDQITTWDSPICDCPDLHKSIRQFLHHQMIEAVGERSLDLKRLTVEAALAIVHQEGVEYFFPIEAAKIMNSLLEERQENLTLSPRKVGALLGDLGIFGERVTKGYKIALTNAVREQVHLLAHAYGLLTAQVKLGRCQYCVKVWTL